MSCNKRIIHQYLKEIRKKIACPRLAKEAFLEELKNRIEEFQAEEPNLRTELLYDKFGSPCEVAESFLNQNDLNKKLLYSKKKLFVYQFITATLSVMLVLVIALFIYTVYYYCDKPDLTLIIIRRKELNDHAKNLIIDYDTLRFIFFLHDTRLCGRQSAFRNHY